MSLYSASLIRDMGTNAGLLCFLAALYSILMSGLRHPNLKVRESRRRWIPWVLGLLFGMTGILTMATPLRMAEGVIIDNRLVMTGLAGAYLSPVAAALCAIALCAYRLYLGGIGTAPAIVGIFLTTGIGLLWKYYRPIFSTQRFGAFSDEAWLLGLGLSIAAGGLFAIQLLPPELAKSVTESSWVPVVIIYPLCTVLLGFLLENTHKLNQREEALEQTAHTLRALLSEAKQAASVFVNSKDAIAIVNPDGKVLDVNPAYSDLFGYSRDELIGKPSPALRNHDLNDINFFNRIALSIDRDSRWSGELVNCSKDGEAIVSEITIEGIRDPDGIIRKWVTVGKDVTEQRRLEQALQEYGNYDALTGLASRRLFAKDLNSTLLACKDSTGILALCLFDIDQFKDLNECWGQPLADQYLRVLAQRLKLEAGPHNLLGRMGADEFAVAIKDCSSVPEALQRLETLRKTVLQTVVLENQKIRLTCSGGVTFYPLDDTDAGGLIRHANLALYSAKEQGKDRIAVFDVKQGQRMQVRRHTAKLVDEALKNGEMELFFQPKIRISDGKIIGAESLIRWNHPEQGLLTPGSFIEHIVGTQVSSELDLWVLNAAFKAGCTLVDSHCPIPLSINISVSTLIDSRFQLEVVRHLRECSYLPRQFLEVELLETETFNDLSAVAHAIQGLHRLGVQCSIDDFGTGYSSLTYLQRLPAQIVKIDQSFVRGILNDERDRALVNGIVSLAHAFNRDVVAEGVETLAHVEALRHLGCDSAQGYAIARPMPLEQLIRWIKSR